MKVRVHSLSFNRIYTTFLTLPGVFNVRPQAHGIHPPRPLVFFSEKLRRIIEKVWRKGPFSRTGREEERGKGEGSLPAPLPEKGSFDFEKEEELLESPALESYEPSRAVSVWELGTPWRGDPFERVRGFFQEMSGYQEDRDRAFKTKCEAEKIGRR